VAPGSVHQEDVGLRRKADEHEPRGPLKPRKPNKPSPHAKGFRQASAGYFSHSIVPEDVNRKKEGVGKESARAEMPPEYPNHLGLS